jgi:hypothetical protein
LVQLALIHIPAFEEDTGSIVEVWGPQATELMPSGYLWHFSPTTCYCSPIWSHQYLGPERRQSWAKCQYDCKPQGTDELCESVCSGFSVKEEAFLIIWYRVLDFPHCTGSSSLMLTQECHSLSMWEVIFCWGKNLKLYQFSW